ncbi:MAG TPA: hypothetical protein DCP90_05500 [Clostridiales bacterium]|nr:MAG: hypothetical protein A2Y22_05635 [Clostridiales bacterium GWD2_32_59]HAN10056.1 hypothetical protein [Clostridiales bacterium]
MFGFTNQNKTKTQIMELSYSRESDILQEINRIAFKTKDLTEATKIVTEILSKYYNIEYCSLFLYNAGKMNICYTNIEERYQYEIEKFVNELYHEKFFDEKEDIDAYIIKSDRGLQYDTAEAREIVHMMFIPLILDQVLGGIMIENTSNNMEELEYEFFQVVVDNISIIIQNLLYFKQIIENSNIDGLTSIYNRYYLNAHLSKQIEIFSEKTGIFSIAMVDIDHFKIFNDTYGHLHGDKVLRAVAQFIKDHIREIDTVYRYGGEEFIIDMPNLWSSDALKQIDIIREGISNMEVYTDEGHLTKVTASFGIAEFPTVSDSMKGLIDSADKALYKAKESGRNQTVVYKI